MEHYNREMENKLIESIKQKEKSDRRLLQIEIVMGIVCLIPLIGAAILVSFVPFEEHIAAFIVIASLIPLLVATPFAIKIEQKAGYYKCKKCGHLHIPQYGSVFWAMHSGRTRYMKCPACGERSWQKKVLTKD